MTLYVHAVKFIKKTFHPRRTPQHFNRAGGVGGVAGAPFLLPFLLVQRRLAQLDVGGEEGLWLVDICNYVIKHTLSSPPDVVELEHFGVTE